MKTFEVGNFLYFEGLMSQGKKDYCFVLKVTKDIEKNKYFLFWDDGSFQTATLSDVILDKFTKIF
jgi:hypothetical protein